MNLYHVIKRPVDTEKFDRARDQLNQYAFEVDRRASKPQVRHAVETIFKVQVTQVTTQILRGKTKRGGLNAALAGQTQTWKRAIVTLKEGDAISLFEGK